MDNNTNKRRNQPVHKFASLALSSNYLPRWAVLCLDLLLAAIAFTIGCVVGTGLFVYKINEMELSFPEQGAILLTVQFLFFCLFRTYSGVLRFSTFIDTIKVLGAVVLTSILALAVNQCTERLWDYKLFVNSMLVLYMGICFVLLFCLRVGAKTTFEVIAHRSVNRKRIYIYDNESKATAIAKMIRSDIYSHYQVTGLIDDSLQASNHEVAGMRVLHLDEKLFSRMHSEDIDGIILSEDKKRELKHTNRLAQFVEHGFNVYTIGGFEEWNNNEDTDQQAFHIGKINGIKIEDLLERPTINIDTENVRLHTKAGYLRIGQPARPLTVEAGMEMGCQFGGSSYTDASGTFQMLENKGGLTGMWHALIPNGYEANEKEMVYKNVDGNHLGSMVGRLNLDYPSWGVSLYVDHFFEDHSQIFFFSNNGYGKDDEWNDKVEKKYFVYDVRDAMWGLELRLKRLSWLNTVVAEYLYTKYQSGPIYHDHTKHMSDQIAGRDNYYNHSVFVGWQHWGQVIGNPLYRSPLYNDDATIMVKDNRFWAIHLGVAGDPLPGLHYRLLYTWQRGFGTYETPLSSPQRNTSMLAEVEYRAAEQSRLQGWSLKGAVGIDRGKLLGDNIGLQLTVARRFSLAH